jgi:16S rRNA (adenine1518-N6/adenine1519-N6)-dimethyltransferase
MPENLPPQAERLLRPSQLRGLLRERGIKLRRSWGQHFLVDRATLVHILEAILELSPAQVVEVGAGVGTLTCALAPHVEKLWAVEVDRRLIPLLAESVGPWPQVEIIQADFLTLPWNQFGDRALVVGNLPYRITSPVLLRLLRARPPGAVFLIQWEVGEKLVAPPGPEASRLGTHLRAYYRLELLRRVPNTVFFPPPEVDAALIRLQRLPAPLITAPPEAFERTLALLFQARRKTIRRALASLLPLPEVDALLSQLGLDPRRRGETLDLEELDRLASALAPRLLTPADGGAPREDSK